MFHYIEHHLPKTWIKHLNNEYQNSKHTFSEKEVSSSVRSTNYEILGTFVLWLDYLATWSCKLQMPHFPVFRVLIPSAFCGFFSLFRNKGASRLSSLAGCWFSWNVQEIYYSRLLSSVKFNWNKPMNSKIVGMFAWQKGTWIKLWCVHTYTCTCTYINLYTFTKY